MGHIIYSIVILLIAFSFASAEEIYTWSDKDGNYLTNIPPSGSVKNKVSTHITPPKTSMPQERRDISSCEKALIGHWQDDRGTEYFISNNKIIQIGKNGDKAPFYYEAMLSNEEKNVLEIKTNRPDLPWFYRKFEFYQGERELAAYLKIRITDKYHFQGKWSYIDAKQEP